MLEFSSFTDDALNSLLTIIDGIRPSNKILILDDTLTSTVNLVASKFSQLKDHGIEKIFWLQGGENRIEAADRKKSLIYLTGTGVDKAFLVAKHAQSVLGSMVVIEDDNDGIDSRQQKQDRNNVNIHAASPSSLHVIVVPERTLAFSHILEESRVLGDLTIHNWPVHFLPIDDDVLSLNLPSGGFDDTYLKGLPSAVHLSARAIQDLQERYGLIGRITGKGDHARILADILLNKREERRTELSEAATNISRTGGGVNSGFLDSIKFTGIGGVTGSTETTTNGKNGHSDQFSDDGGLASSTVFSHKFSNIFVGTHIDHLIIFDRKSDFVTPLLTQLTYHGLIDEFYKMSESGQVDVPASVLQPTNSQQQQQQQQLSSSSSVIGSTSATITKKASLYSENDTLFHTIKDTNFAVVGQSLNRIARQLQADYDARHEANTVSQIKSFVSKLGGLQSLHQSLRFHTALAEDVMSKVQAEEFNKWLEVQQNIVAESLDTNTILLMIEELISRSSSLSMILRLISLECLCKGGIKEKQLLALKHQIVQTYGYKHILTLSNLEKLGFIFARAPSIPNNFPWLRKSLNLIVDQTEDATAISSAVATSGNNDSTTINDVSMAYSGYAPLSVRLVQCVIDKRAVIRPRRLLPNVATPSTYASVQAVTASSGWKGAEDIINSFPGSVIEDIQRSESQLREAKLRKILTRNTPGHDKQTTLVFYLGGITYAEVAALRFVGQKDSLNTNILIATTGIISGDKIIDIAMQR